MEKKQEQKQKYKLKDENESSLIKSASEYYEESKSWTEIKKNALGIGYLSKADKR